MVKIILISLLIAFRPVVGVAQSLPTQGERQAAAITSWVSVAAAVALDARASYDCQDRLRCYEYQALRTSAVYAAVFGAKLLVHRDRPCARLPEGCGIDNPAMSFFSGHTALAFSTLGGPRLEFSIPLAIGTGGLRVAAGKHWPTDVLVGAGVGALMSRIR